MEDGGWRRDEVSKDEQEWQKSREEATSTPE
jgi:hypothetical protein